MRFGDFLRGLVIGSALTGVACSGSAAVQPQQQAAAPAAVPVTVRAAVRKAMPLDAERRRHRRGLFHGVGARADYRRAHRGQLPAGRRRDGGAGALHARSPAARRRAAAGAGHSRARHGAGRQRQGDRASATSSSSSAASSRASSATTRAPAWRALEATLASDRAAVENAKVQLQYATIRAPISGRTGALMVNAGNLVRANDQAPLVTINQVTPIYVSFAFPEPLLPDLRRYMARGALRVEARPSSGEGHLAVGTDHVHRQRGRSDDRHDQGQGHVPERRSAAVARPVRQRRGPAGDRSRRRSSCRPLAVQTGPDGSYVYLVKADQTVELRPVTVARVAGDRNGDQGRPRAGRHRRHRRPPAARAGQPHQRARRRGRQAGIMNFAGALHQAADHDDAHHAGHHRVRRDVVPAAAGERPADGRLPDHPGAGGPARRQPRDDGVGGGAAARKTVRDHRRPRLGQLDQHAGQHQHHAAVRARAATSTPRPRTCRR